MEEHELFGGFRDRILESLCSRQAYSSVPHLISWFTELRTRMDMTVNPCGLDDLESWSSCDDHIKHCAGKYFEVMGVHAEVGKREVAVWDQPLVKQVDEGLVGFLVKEIGGVWHLLVQAKVEPGNLDVLAMAPTVQCITGSYKKMEYPVPYIDWFIGSGTVHYDTLQSEEGGRFYHEQNRYMLVEVGDDFPLAVSDFYCWMTFYQLKQFILFNNYVNIEARSLIACVSPV